MRFSHGYVYQYQTTAFKLLLIICLVSSVAFLLVNFYRGLLLLASFQTLFAGFSGLVLLLLLKGKLDGILYKASHAYLLILYSLFFLALLSIPNINNTIFSVIFLVSPVSYLLLGHRWGFLYTAVFSLTMLFVYFYRLASETDMFNFGVLGNLSVCLVTVWLFSHLYEKSRKQSQELMVKSAAEDSLTHLLNRSALSVILVRDLRFSINQNGALGIVIIDIDWFQIINDNYGHKLGDKILVQLAHIIKQNIRHSDSAFRLAGQEFCLSLPNTTLKGAYNIAEKIRTTIERSTFQIDETVVSLTISVGVVGCDSKDYDLDYLLKQAYKCMYQAKKGGRNQIIMQDK